MKSHALGRRTSSVEVQDITRFGLWLYCRGREYFLPYKHYPWFENAKISAVQNVRLFHNSHLYWPDLDVDLEVDSLQEPEKYPLVYK